MGQKITPGRIVHYRDEAHNEVEFAPAIVAATPDNINPEAVDAGRIPELADGEVHLVVFNAAFGQYAVHNVKEGEGVGTWSWPPRVGT